MRPMQGGAIFHRAAPASTGPLLLLLLLLALLVGAATASYGLRQHQTGAAGSSRQPSDGDEEPAIVINSKHSASSALASNSQQQQRRFHQHQSLQHQSQQQPSQEFDSAAGRVAQPTSFPAAGPSTRRQEAHFGVSSAALIRDTSELAPPPASLVQRTHNSPLELEQRRAIIARPSPNTTTTLTTESWMQSVRDNHHGPLRSRLNLIAGHQLQSTNAAAAMPLAVASSLNTRRLVSGEQVTPVGDSQQIVLDGHMKTRPGPSQPVPYEQQLAKSVRATHEPPSPPPTTVQSGAGRRPVARRNSKFTRRSTEYQSESDPPPTTPLYRAVDSNPSTTSRATVAAAATNLTTIPCPEPTTDGTNRTRIGGPPSSKTAGAAASASSDLKTKTADFKTILMSNNHKASSSGPKFKDRRGGAAPAARPPRRLDFERLVGVVPEPATRQQQPVSRSPSGGWSPRLWPSLLQRTIGSAYRRLLTTTTTTAPTDAAIAPNSFGHYGPTPVFGAAQQAPASPGSLGVANLIVSALSAAVAAAANSKRSPTRPLGPMAVPTDEDQLAQLEGGRLGQRLFAGAHSMRHELREPALRQHANKKIIDSMVDLPVSERRTLANYSAVPATSGSRRARMSPAERQEFELAAGNNDDHTDAGWSTAAEPAADFDLGANQTSAAGRAQQPAADGEELDEDDQLDFRTTTDSSAAGDDLADAGDESADETLETADSIIVPDRRTLQEMARHLGEPLLSSSDGGDHDDDQAGPADGDEDRSWPLEEAAGAQEEAGVSLFYAPAPSELPKNYRRGDDWSAATSDGESVTGEGSFARLAPPTASGSGRPRAGPHRNKIRRPQLVPIEPAAFHEDNQAAADEADDLRQADGVAPMRVPAPIRPAAQAAPARRRPSSSGGGHLERKPSLASMAAPALSALSLKETRRPPARDHKNRTGGAPSIVGWSAPKVAQPERTEMMSPMSSSISVLDLDPSMTRLAHNKLIVAKFKPKIKQPPKIGKPAGVQSLSHRSTSVSMQQQQQPERKQQINRLGVQANAEYDQGNEVVSRRWQTNPARRQAQTSERDEAPPAPIEKADGAQIRPDDAQSGSRSSEPDQARPLRVAGDFHFLMPGLASGLAARISGLTRPHTGTATTSAPTTTAATTSTISTSAAGSPSADSELSQREQIEQNSPQTPSSLPAAASYSGNRNDKFNFSLLQMNNRERVNPLLFPIERFSNSSSYSVQQQQKELLRNKPSSHRSRLTTSRPTTTTTTTTTTTASTIRHPNDADQTPGVRGTTTSATRPPLRTTSRPYARSTSSVRPKTTTQRATTTSTTTTASRPDDDLVGQILRNQHHQQHRPPHSAIHRPPPPPPRNGPMSESERLRNQYQALIGKNSSLDGRISSSADASGSAANPLGHMSLIEAAHDANKYTTLEASAASTPAAAAAATTTTATGEAALNEHSVVILSDNHHEAGADNRRRLGASPLSPTNSNRLPPFNAGHTRYELLATAAPAQETARKHLEELVNGTRIRPSSLSKVAPPSNSSTSNRRAQPGVGAFNSVQGSPPVDPDSIGRLDLRAQELLFDMFDREPSYATKSQSDGSHRKLGQQEDFSSSGAHHERIRTHSTVTLTPVESAPTQSAVGQQQQQPETTTAAPERAYLDLGESADLNNRASMRRSQAKIESILAALANRTASSASESSETTTTITPQTPNNSEAANNSSSNNNNNEGDQEFKTTATLAADFGQDETGPDSSEQLASFDTTRFYAPIKLTTRSSYQFRPATMSTPSPGRGYPSVETLSGSRQKINKPGESAAAANFEYSPVPPTTTMATATSTQSASDEPTESSAAYELALKQTIWNRMASVEPAASTPMDSSGQEEATTSAGPSEEPTTSATPTTTTSTATTEPDILAELQMGPARRRPTINDVDVGDDDSNSNGDDDDAAENYPTVASFAPSKPLRPVIIRRRPTRRPPPQRVAIGPGEQAPPAANKPARRRKRPTKRPAPLPQQNFEPASSAAHDRRKVVVYHHQHHRPRPISAAELADSPMLIRRRPGAHTRLPLPDSIRIHSAAPAGEQRNKTTAQRPPVSAPISLILPSLEPISLKRKDHDIRTRPLTIMDPQSSGERLGLEAVLNPSHLSRVPETTVVHDKVLVSYKPGRPLPKPSRQQQQDDLASASNLVDSLIHSIASSAPANLSSSLRPAQLGSGNGGDTHLISIEQQQREHQQTSTRGPPIAASTPSGILAPGPEQPDSGASFALDSAAPANASAPNSANQTATTITTTAATNLRPIIVINGMFGEPHQPNKPADHHRDRRPALGSSSSLLEAGSMSVVAQASHGQANASRPWYPTAGVSSWPSGKHNNNNNSNNNHEQSPSSGAGSSQPTDLASQSSPAEQSPFGGSEMANFGAGSSSSSAATSAAAQPSGSYQNHQLQHQQQHIGMPFHHHGSSQTAGGGSRPVGQRPPNRWRVRRRPQGNNSSSATSGSSSSSSNANSNFSSAGYNFSSASSAANYVYRPLLGSVNSFGALFDNVQIFFARIRTFIISLMVMFLPPLALAASVVNAMSA